jgi:hypothetical protein
VDQFIIIREENGEGKSNLSNLFIMHFVFGRKNCRSEEETGFCMWVYLILAAWG